MGNTGFSIHEKITALRNKHGLSQNDMADAAKIPRRTYQNIEYKRTQQIPVDYVISIARALGTTVGEIIGEAGAGQKNKTKKTDSMTEVLSQITVLKNMIEKQVRSVDPSRQELIDLILGLPEDLIPDAINDLKTLIQATADESEDGSSRKRK